MVTFDPHRRLRFEEGKEKQRKAADCHSPINPWFLFGGFKLNLMSEFPGGPTLVQLESLRTFLFPPAGLTPPNISASL